MGLHVSRPDVRSRGEVGWLRNLVLRLFRDDHDVATDSRMRMGGIKLDICIGITELAIAL